MNRKKTRLLSVILGVAMLSGTALSVEAAPAMMSDGTFFDAEYYAQSNPDVVAVMGTDATALYNHYVFNGKAEGRLPYNPAVDVSAMVDSATYAAAVDVTLLPTDSNYFELKTALPGTYITFGTYEQDNNKRNGQEPIEWLVLENNGESILVISKYVLDGVPYSTAYDTYTYNAHPITWEYCSLRAWLNSTFYTTAFNAGEQARIQTTLLDNRIIDPIFVDDGLDGGNNTLDNVFLLSYREVLKYFPMKDVWYSNDGLPINYDKLLQAVATPYAVAQGVDVWSERDAKTAVTNGGGYASIAYDVIGYVEKWALRTPHMAQTCVYNLGASGSFGFRTATYDHGNRPAMRINIK